MQFEDLPEALKEAVVNTKHNSMTLHLDVKDALENAESLEEFEDNVFNSLSSRVDEATQLRNTFDKAFAECAKDSPDVQKDNNGGDKTPETT